MIGGCSKDSRAAPYGSTAALRASWMRASRHLRFGATRSLRRKADEQHKLGRKIAMEEDWLCYGVTARRTRNQRRLAELHALRRKRREHRGASGTPGIEAVQADLSVRLVVAAESISKAYGDHLVVRNFSV